MRYGTMNKLKLKILLGCFLVVAFVNEVLIYKLQSYRWPSFPNIDRESGKYQVVLLVADPQIQGYQDEPMFPIGTITRWDSDRYLWKTFSQAFDYSKPDVIVFLGDLMDEGSKASTAEYATTLERFKGIFPPISHVKTIYIPGDNDIGGEGRDFIKEWKVIRYEKHFGNITNIHHFGFIDYVKLDITPSALTQEKIEAARSLQKKLISQITVLFNHKTFLASAKYFTRPISKRLRPKIVFSAHHHTARLLTCKDCLLDNEYSWSVLDQDLTIMDSYEKFDLSARDAIVEVSAPTCSYRMGVADMGYTVAIIGEDGSFQFTILWLPRRYTMLLGYLLVRVVAFLISCMSHFSGRRR